MSEEEKSLKDLSYGERLKFLRERAGLSQYDLGELIGVIWRVIYYYESESKYPPFKVMKKMCSALGVTADELLGIDPLPERDPRTIEGKLLKRFCKVKDLSKSRQRALFQVIEGLIELEEREQKKKKG